MDEVHGTLGRVGSAAWRLTVRSPQASLLLTWLRDLSDGFVAMETGDPFKKSPGPAIVRLLGGAGSLPKAARQAGDDKPWYIGASSAAGGASLPEFNWKEPADSQLRRTALFDTHRKLGAKMVPFAGWEMPVWYTSVVEEHLATRSAAGLFDVTHGGLSGRRSAGGAVPRLGLLATSMGCGERLTPAPAPTVRSMTYDLRRRPKYLIVVALQRRQVGLAGAVRRTVRVDGRRPGAGLRTGLFCATARPGGG
jgi:glycine hydroxymethyltransferase